RHCVSAWRGVGPLFREVLRRRGAPTDGGMAYLPSMSKKCLAKTMVSVHRCHACVAIATSIPVFFGKKTFAPDVYPDSGRPWNLLLASAEHERHRVQDASAVGRSLMKRVLEADPQQASKG